jgi:hypothetical protein
LGKIRQTSGSGFGRVKARRAAQIHLALGKIALKSDALDRGASSRTCLNNLFHPNQKHQVRMLRYIICYVVCSLAFGALIV